MRKIISVLLAVLLLAGALSGCQTGGQADKLQVVTTIFPAYDWVRQILGDAGAAAEITMLLDNGVDLHSYQPTADDMVRISSCDLFIYVGGESDAWVEDALKNPVNENRIVIDLMEVLGDAVKEAETVEGMEHDHDHEEEAEHGHAQDEHIWLSLKNAKVLCRHIAQKLGEVDPENQALYGENAQKYMEKLDALDARYQEAVDNAAVDTLLFADRFPFLYLTEDYGLSYYAAFSGCSAETEASFETIAFLSGKVDELGLDSVLVIEGSDQSVARTVIDNTNAKNQTVLSMNSMQAVTAEAVSAGVTYLSVMEQNLEVLKDFLN